MGLWRSRVQFSAARPDGRHVHAEGAELADVLERIGRSVLRELEHVPDDLLNQPVPVSEANTLFALATHLVGAGEFWVLTLAGGRVVARDRDAEFRASGSYADLAQRYHAWIGDVREVLALELAPGALDRLAEPPVQYRGSIGDQPMTVRACVLHAIEHSALHLGQIQLTRSLLSSPVVGRPG
jgi:uncharacterized damage-inducible protein DinB